MTAGDSIVEFVWNFHASHGYAPSVREVAQGIGMSLSQTHLHMSRLREEKRIDYEPGMARTVRVIGAKLVKPKGTR